MINLTEFISPVRGLIHEIAPSTFRTIKSVTRNGKARNKSVILITMSSKRPPRKPATDPTSAPIVTETIALTKPIINETRTP